MSTEERIKLWRDIVLRVLTADPALCMEMGPDDDVVFSKKRTLRHYQNARLIADAILDEMNK